MNTNKHTQARIILHVGNGLDEYSKGEAPLVAIDKLKSMMTRVYADLSAHKHIRYLVNPESLRSEAHAFNCVLTAFSNACKEEATVLSVALYSSTVLSAVISALIDLDMGASLVVCLHHEPHSYGSQGTGRYTLHGLDADGFLENWPYGVLDPQPNNMRELKQQFAEMRAAEATLA